MLYYRSTDSACCARFAVLYNNETPRVELRRVYARVHSGRVQRRRDCHAGAAGHAEAGRNQCGERSDAGGRANQYRRRDFWHADGGSAEQHADRHRNVHPNGHRNIHANADRHPKLYAGAEHTHPQRDANPYQPTREHADACLGRAQS